MINDVIELKVKEHAIKSKLFEPDEFLDWFYAKSPKWQQIYQKENIVTLNKWRWSEINDMIAYLNNLDYKPDSISPHQKEMLESLFTREVGKVIKFFAKRAQYKKDKEELFINNN